MKRFVKDQQQWHGILWKLLACLGFAGVNALVRYLAGGTGTNPHPLPEEVMIFFQNVFAFLIFLPFSLPHGFKGLRTKRKFIAMHIVRVGSAIVGILSLYKAFSVMPIAQVVSLQFTGPIFSVLGARLFLKERIGFWRHLGILLGIMGAFVITRPDKCLRGENDFGWSVLLPLLSAIMFAVSKISSRDLGRKGESPNVLAVYLLFFMVPASAMTASFNWTLPMPDQWILVLVLGAFSCLAHYATVRAYCLAEVTFLTPFGFARILFSFILAALLYNEYPRGLGLWVGLSLIILSTACMIRGDSAITTKTLLPEEGKKTAA